MLIGINELNEIKQINAITDETLTQIEVDRETVFGDMSDFMILNYKYTPYEYGYSLTPAFDYSTLALVDTLHRENVALRENAQQQDTIIMENDMRLMDVEIVLEEFFKGENALVQTIALVSTYSSSFDLLHRIVSSGNYTDKEGMKANIQKYYDRKRITEEEYYELLWILYPETKPMPLEAEVVKTEEEVTPKKRTRKKSK